MASDGDVGRRSCATEKRSAMALRGAPRRRPSSPTRRAQRLSPLRRPLPHTLCPDHRPPGPASSPPRSPQRPNFPALPMADDMPLDRAYLVAIWLETLMFGQSVPIRPTPSPHRAHRYERLHILGIHLCRPLSPRPPTVPHHILHNHRHVPPLRRACRARLCPPYMGLYRPPRRIRRPYRLLPRYLYATVCRKSCHPHSKCVPR